MALTRNHILVVDDDEGMRDLMAEYLGENEFRVTTASNGEEMSRVLADEVVDLVILDLRLVGEDGMTLAQKIRSESSMC